MKKRKYDLQDEIKLYRELAFKIRGHYCENCNKLTKDLDLHHIDKDRTNNTRINLFLLCRPCHIDEHQKIGVL